MEIRFYKRDRTLMVMLNGGVDHHTAEQVRLKTEREYMIAGCKHILFDFSGVNFMDSSGIGMVIGRYKLARSNGGKTVVSGLSRATDRIFEMSGLKKIIHCYVDAKEALDCLSQER